MVLQGKRSMVKNYRGIYTFLTAAFDKLGGDPGKVIELKRFPLQRPRDDQVVVQWLLSPVNPSDINMIQGTYPIKPYRVQDGAYIPGNEGVGKVVWVGPKITSELRLGDRVLPATGPLGTWRSVSIQSPSELFPVKKITSTIGSILLSDLDLAQMAVNPTSAYRMLRDFKSLTPGKDIIIQNGSNSAVGRAVIQLSKMMRIPSINVVRDRPNFELLKQELQALGADHVYKEEELEQDAVVKEIKSLNPCLALNCVGGRSATNLARLLGKKGTMVTYGAMSKKPVLLPTSLLIFNDISFRGFWMTQWKNEHSAKESMKMYSDLAKIIASAELKLPKADVVAISDDSSTSTARLREAIQTSMSGFTGKKIILSLQQDDIPSYFGA